MTMTLAILTTSYVAWLGGVNGDACTSHPNDPCPFVRGTAACGWGLPNGAVIELLDPPVNAPRWLTCTSRGDSRNPLLWADIALGPALRPTPGEIALLEQQAADIGRSYRQVVVYLPDGVPLPVVTHEPALQRPQRNLLTRRDHLLTARQELRTQPAPLLGRSINNARKARA